jgi:uncharacterized protein (DUF58 family)
VSVQTKRRPARRAGTVALVGCLLLFAGATAQAGWLFVLAAGVFGTIAAALVVRPRLSAISIERTLPRRVQVGDEVPVVLRFRGPPKRRAPALRAQDLLAAFEPVAVACPELGPGEAADARTVRAVRRRGVFGGGPVGLETTAPLGFLRSRCTIDVPGEITVVPHVVELARFGELEAPAPYGGSSQAARVGPGVDYIGVRDYRPGDALRSVHWRSVARTGRLIVREFEDEVRSRVALVLAAPEAGDPPDSAFEALVSAAASIAHLAGNRGHDVDLVRPGSTVRGVGISAALGWLAAARPGDAPLVPLVDGALAGMSGGGTVVLLTASRGRAAADVAAGVGRAKLASCRAVVVRALSSSWDGGEGPDLTGDAGAPVRTVVRGKDLRACLEG